MAEIIELGNGCRLTRQTFEKDGRTTYFCTVITAQGDTILTSTEDVAKDIALASADAYMLGYRRGMTRGAEDARLRIRDAMGIAGGGW